MSKIIYKPKGKAREYSFWAANFYNGCSNLCDYCYNRKGVGSSLLGKDTPTLKSGLDTEAHAYDVFCKELDKYKESIINDGGLFFNFVSDPCLPETWMLNWECIQYAMSEGVPCRLLTKRAEVADYLNNLEQVTLRDCQHLLKVGFTLTGCDELEPNASTNAERIEAMKRIFMYGIDTWASIEPIVNLNKSADVIERSLRYCMEYKIGLLSGQKEYTKEQVKEFYRDMSWVLEGKDVTWKESIKEWLDN